MEWWQVSSITIYIIIGILFFSLMRADEEGLFKSIFWSILWPALLLWAVVVTIYSNQLRHFSNVKMNCGTWFACIVIAVGILTGFGVMFWVYNVIYNSWSW